MRVKVHGSHRHHGRGVLLFKLYARNQTSMYNYYLADALDRANVQYDRASLEPPRLLIAQRAGQRAFLGFLLRGLVQFDILLVARQECIHRNHLMSEKQDAVFVVATHTRGSKLAGKIHNSSTIGALVNYITREDQMVSICHGELDLFE
jgi:hypothetical protein